MFIRTEDGEKLLWHLSEVDAQKIAKEKINRKLTEAELLSVQKALESGFENCWHDILESAVDSVIEESAKGGGNHV